jgi:1,4-alpha-glucan branching enzyme
MKTSKGRKSKKVTFSLSAPQATSVSLAGDFNDWNTTAHPMKRDKEGIWKASLNLAQGTYEYRFFVDGEWQNDPTCTDCVGNPFGTANCVKKVN